MKLGHRFFAMALVLVAAIMFIRFAPKQPLLGAQPWSTAVYAEKGELLRLSLARDEQYRLKTHLHDISPQLINATLLYEDRWFYWHPGVNPWALTRSFWASLTRRKQGGSTITMQLARRLYQIDSRDPVGKLKQVFAALWLEIRYSKREILEAYFNLAPFGGNVEGVGAASLIFFRKLPAQLTLPEALALAVIPQNPRQRRVTDVNNVPLRQARTRLWKKWVAHYPNDVRWAGDQALPLQVQARRGLPFYAPHVVDLALLDRTTLQRTKPDLEKRVSIDLQMQETLEGVISDYLAGVRETGVNNASALLLDADTMQVKALVGSANYFNADIHGQVNGTRGKRSPGSTLKPFLYGLALDQGLLHPKTILKDAPTAFGSYSPENFDGRFSGPVAAEDALIRSRNVPAVAVSAKLAKPSLYDFLKLAGIDRMASAEHYGLALVLGGGEVTMEELGQLYAMLANGGVWQPLSYAARPPQLNASRRLLSEEAAYVVLDMLQRNPRPDTFAPAHPAIAWKTGTSWGFRDAWTAGIFGRYVLVVWLGNFDGSSNPQLIGVDMAAPLFLRIVDGLRARRVPKNVTTARPPQNLRKISVCAISGDLPDPLCGIQTETWFIAGKSPIKTNTMHRQLWVNRHNGRATCHPSANSDTRIYEFWSSDFQQVFSDAGLPRHAPPSEVSCASAGLNDGGPKIATPLRGVTYSLRASHTEVLSLRANASGGVSSLFWFVNNSLVGRTRPGESLLWRPPGPQNYTVRVVDDVGRVDTRELVVAYVP